MPKKSFTDINDKKTNASISASPNQIRAAIELYGGMTRAFNALMAPVLDQHIKKCNNVAKINS